MLSIGKCSKDTVDNYKSNLYLSTMAKTLTHSAFPGFAERLAKARKQKRLGQRFMADVCGLDDYQSYQAYENGKAFPPRQRLSKIVAALGISEHMLLFGREQEIHYPDVQIVVVARFKNAVREAERGIDVSQYLGLPLLEEQWAGGSAREINEHVRGWTVIHRNQLKGRERGNLIAVQITGDSMYPIIRSGAIVAVDQHEREPVKDSEAIYAIRTEGSKATIKHVKREGQLLVLYPANLATRETFPPYIDLAIDQQPIIGRVIWCWQPLI